MANSTVYAMWEETAMSHHGEIAEFIIQKSASDLQEAGHLWIGRRIRFTPCPFVFGRFTHQHELPQPALHIPSLRISKLHAGLVFENHRFWIVRYSKNLIALNGREIERGPKYVLENGDTIVFAGVLKFQICLSAGDTVPVPRKGIWLSTTPHPAVEVNGKLLDPPLTATEFKFLEILFQNAGSAVTRDQIFEHVWPHEYATENQLDRTAHRLRERLDDSRDLIITQRGVGYKLEQPPQAWDNVL
jgi:hypothetical protein